MLNYASSGNGQSTHLSAELFNMMAGVKLNHVPYKGSAPALTDVIAGQVPLMFDTMLSSMPFVKSGKLKAIAVTSPQRSPVAPDVPTIAESGLPGYEVFAWNGVLAPAGTPPTIISRLSEELKKALELPAVKDKFAVQGFRGHAHQPGGSVPVCQGRGRQVGPGGEGLGGQGGVSSAGMASGPDSRGA